MALHEWEDVDWEGAFSEWNSLSEPSLDSVSSLSEYSFVRDDDLPRDNGNDYSEEDVLRSSFVGISVPESAEWPPLHRSAMELLTSRSPRVTFVESTHAAPRTSRRTMESRSNCFNTTILCSEKLVGNFRNDAYDEAGRSADHTFQDTRSPSKAVNRRRAEAEKYWGFRAVKRGTLGKPVMVQPGTIWQPKETYVVPMSKRLRWKAAQEPPRPDKWHRKPSWYRSYYSFDSLKVRKHAHQHLLAELDEAPAMHPEEIAEDIMWEADQEEFHEAHYDAVYHAQCTMEQCRAEKVTVRVAGDDFFMPEVQEPKEYWLGSSDARAWHVPEQVRGESFLTPEPLVYHLKAWCPRTSGEWRPITCFGLCYGPEERTADL